MTGSLLKGGEGDEGEGDTCPPLLSAPPVSPRLQSNLHCINLSIQQVKSGLWSKSCSVSPAAETEKLSVCAGVAGRGLWQCRQRENLPDLSHPRTGEAAFTHGGKKDIDYGLVILIIDVLTDDCVGGRCGRQRKAGLRRSASLDPERNTARQHPVWTRVPGGQVRGGHLGYAHKPRQVPQIRSGSQSASYSRVLTLL